MQNLQSILTHFDPKSGLSKDKPSLKRHLADMKGMFSDADAFEKKLSEENILVYEFYDMGVPNSEKEIAYGTSITYPGKIGSEYFMTKGHFHTILDTAEVYFCLNGEGYMVMENPEGDCEAQLLKPGHAVYVPARFAHRSVNTSSTEPLVTFFAFPGHAGHNYGLIEEKGFRKLLIEQDGKPVIIDNPNWK